MIIKTLATIALVACNMFGGCMIDNDIAEVIDIVPTSDTVVFETAYGKQISSVGIEDWMIGDCAEITSINVGHPQCYKCLTARYIGQNILVRPVEYYE